MLASFSSGTAHPTEPTASNEKTAVDATTELSSSPEGSVHVAYSGPAAPRTTLLVRPEKGLTRTLLTRTKAAEGHLNLPALIESSYHSQNTSALRRCSTLLAIAGGVGITAILPLARSFPGPEARLYWGVKHEDIVEGVKSELLSLKRTCAVEVKIGGRFDVAALIREEALAREANGDLAVVVCGPAEMADDVRKVVGAVAAKTTRKIVFRDDAFSW